MTVRVWPTPEAEAQIEEKGRWWRANRTKAPDLFKRQLERVVDLLAAMPNLGKRYTKTPVPGVRRLRLRGTPYHLYFLHRPDLGDLVLLSVWSGAHPEGPRLKAP